MSRKIGFRSYYENEKDEKEQEKQNELEKIKAE